MLAPGDRVVVENPGYLPAIQLLRTVGAKVTRVPVDDEGLIVDCLPKTARLLYVSPSHQYPLGVTMSMQRRQSLLAWAERSNCAIIEDDYDSEFRFGGRPLEPLHNLDPLGRVIYIGTFSKTLLPSMRIGFVLAPPLLRDAFHKAKHVMDWHTNSLVQAALARFIDCGEYARYLRKLRKIYQARHEKTFEILRRDFHGVLMPIPSVAGIHIAALAEGASFPAIDSVVERALEQDVQVHSLSRYPVDRGDKPGLVLGYGAIATEDIEEGLRRLRTCFDT
jgi:GntR family transcriptional regulator/MocR family aminotransferase